MFSKTHTPAPPKQPSRGWMHFNRLNRWLLLPAGVYLFLFFASQPHYLGSFSRAFFIDAGDGFQNIWNIWWVNKALTELGTSPYFTTMLHWPHGTTLLPQTMNIFNGLVGIPLMHLFGFSLIQTVNFAVVFSFVMGGITMLWFIQKLFGRYWVSVVAGGLFTFSSYHFAHAQGHLQLVSLEWVPLFLLAFWVLLEKMRYRYALLAAGALFLVMLCDFYYLLWCVVIGGMWLAWCIWKKTVPPSKHTVKVLAVFSAASLALIGPLVYGLARLSSRDPLLGSHDPERYALDPLSVIIPGGSWRWAWLTEWHWSKLEYFAETSVFFGFGLLSLCIIYLVKRRQLKPPAWLNFWVLLGLVFGIISLGPRFSSFGKTAHFLPLPYALLEKVFPMLEISGMPVRWTMVSLMAAIVIGAFVLSKIDLSRQRGLILVGLFLLVSIVDLMPAKLPLTVPPRPSYVEFLRQQSDGAILDTSTELQSYYLYYQTIHERPMAFGYVTRVPQSVDRKNAEITADLENKRLDRLCGVHHLRFLVVRGTLSTDYPVVFQDTQNGISVYDLQAGDSC